MEIDDQFFRRNRRFLKSSVNKPSRSEEVLEENTKEAVDPVAQAIAGAVPNELQLDESAAGEEQPTLETEPNTHPDPAQQFVRGRESAKSIQDTKRSDLQIPSTVSGFHETLTLNILCVCS